MKEDDEEKGIASTKPSREDSTQTQIQAVTDGAVEARSFFQRARAAMGQIVHPVTRRLRPKGKK